jgi:hypothetical protein
MYMYMCMYMFCTARTALTTARRPLLRRLPPAPLAYVHLDIEGAEFEVVPHLLVSGALCRVSHLHIEWHATTLLSRGDEAVAMALGQRLALQHLVRSGCRGSSSNLGIRIDHEDSAGQATVYKMFTRATWRLHNASLEAASHGLTSAKRERVRAEQQRSQELMATLTEE